MPKTRCRHDAAYKSLFTDPEMVASLLRRFAPADVVADMDFSSLEPFPTEHVAEDRRARRNDIVWRVRLKDAYCYLLPARIPEQGRLVDGGPHSCVYRPALMGCPAPLKLDIAKNKFQVHGEDKQGKKVFNKQLARRDVLPFFANHPACLVGLEACGGAHYWAREISKLGHDVRLIPPRQRSICCGGSPG